MKKVFTLAIALMIAFAANAQNDVTKFLGIPVDGTKNAMKQKLIQKGFEYDNKTDLFEGQFNGADVFLSIVTNNNKVYRICVIDENLISETDIKIRFNSLCRQFERNEKYNSFSDDQTIPEDEDISHEMFVDSKRYNASYFQKDKDGMFDFNRLVWFMIDEKYGEYRILMFYDNVHNQANGEDL